MTEQLQKKRRLSLCVGCGAQIHDQYILRVAPDLEWHAACLKCAECHQFLDETCTCFVRDGKTYCKRDYVRLFGTKCDKCGLSFSKTDFVMRAKTKIYHIECFRCSACERHLIPGDEFALREDGLFCKEDHEVLEKATNRENNNNTTNVNNNNSSHNNNNEGSNSDSSESGSNKGREGSRVSGSTKVSSDGKPTRVRTVLNEKQLHTLRTCYNANPRPDALMKEQLVEMTGLSPRVIRVWFQNKRCKDKKKAILMKQQMQQEKAGGAFGRLILFSGAVYYENDGRKLGYGSMQGIPMVASSPVRHESPLGINPIEVQSYQPPWKALTEFALHTDLDRLDPSAPPFQQLVSQMHGYDLHGAPPPSHDLGPPPSDMAHPDSTDSYVTYLESDDSLHHDTSSP
ncbi:insulin gene enhancer protein isl-1 isoform X1 [Cryptotermes secundus]|uniref:insulin gene enhancer protein isl-1 isoform X1 n=1 Tax=Cryptotermes secundus TaxID=105785 RepID=UPI000CD7D2D2|nr:insulin gene enhancer protein isl-1 isoform X1 [Cryptotermes secundus]XP_023717776.1 insulin gene enhancer protein isl-1 isoform X1 [Cryptotermes secundus]